MSFMHATTARVDVNVLALLAMPTLVLGALAVFVVRTMTGGRVRNERVASQGGTVFLSEFAMDFGYWLAGPVIRGLIRLGVHPDTLSYTALAVQFAAAFALGSGRFATGGWLLAMGAGMDALDGAVARGRKVASKAGEVLDSTVDRWAELAVFLSLIWYYRADAVGFWLAGASLAGALVVSYARAKAEVVGVNGKHGLMQRHERAVYLCAGTVLSPLLARYSEPDVVHPRHHLVLATLALIAVFTNLTAIQRTRFTRAELRKRQP